MVVAAVVVAMVPTAVIAAVAVIVINPIKEVSKDDGVFVLTRLPLL